MAKRHSAVPITGKGKKDMALWRIVHPTDPTLFYAKANSPEPWVKWNYAVWYDDEWQERFAAQQPDGRGWQKFGYIIPLHDDDDTQE